MTGLRLICLIAAVPSIAPQPVRAQKTVEVQTTGTTAASSYAVHVAQAARRFAISEQWVWAVIGQESGGDAGAVSRAGAMGLMQIMPATWSQLRARLSLGSNPFDPADNIMAGTAYLRDMYDRYGAQGMLAAYNAGPGRYEEYLRGERALPSETRAYLHRLGPIIGVGHAPAVTPAMQRQPPVWTEAGLFPPRESAQSVSPAGGSDAIPDLVAEAMPPMFIARTERRP